MQKTTDAVFGVLFSYSIDDFYCRATSEKLIYTDSTNTVRQKVHKV